MNSSKNTGAAQAAPVHQVIGLHAPELGGPPAENMPEIISTEEMIASGRDKNGNPVTLRLIACRLTDGRRVIESEGADKLTMFLADGGGMLVTEQDKITRFLKGLDLGNAGVGVGKVLKI